MTALEIFISQHQFLSYAVVFIGIMVVESDLFFLTAAVFADQKHLNWGALLIVAFVAVFTGDAIFYSLGKYSRETRVGNWFMRRFGKYVDRIENQVDGRYATIAFFCKFLYYVNRIVPFLAGWREMPVQRFLKTHLLIGLSWLAVMTTIGVSLGAIVDLVGPRWVLERIWVLFLALAIIFVGGDHFLKRLFSRKIIEK